MRQSANQADTNGPFAEMLGQAQAGSQLAMSRLFLEFHDRLLARVERRLPDDMRRLGWAEDVVQEALKGAAVSLATFKPKAGMDPRDAVFRWLCSIAEHRMLDIIRHENCAKEGGGRAKVSMDAGGSTSLGPLLTVLAGDPTPSRIARGREFEAAVRAAMDRLYPAYREALELRLVLGLSTDEIRVRLAKENNASVRKLLSRAIQGLREELGDTSRYLSRV